MKTRKVLAAATLAALPLVAGVMHSGPDRAAADAARHPNATERSSGPRVLYWAGVDGETAALISVFATPNSGINWLIGY